jgi:hypothetical protein
LEGLGSPWWASSIFSHHVPKSLVDMITFITAIMTMSTPTSVNTITNTAMSVNAIIIINIPIPMIMGMGMGMDMIIGMGMGMITNTQDTLMTIRPSLV